MSVPLGVCKECDKNWGKNTKISVEFLGFKYIKNDVDEFWREERSYHRKTILSKK